MSLFAGQPGSWVNFVLLGPCRTKKNSGRIIRAGSRRMLLPSLAYSEWNQSAQFQLAELRASAPDDAFPFRSAVNVKALFFRQRDVGDACNYYEALADTLQEAGIVENDSLIRAWDGSRLLVDKDNPRVIVRIDLLDA